MTIITEITKPTITIDGETGVVEVAVQGEQGVDAVLQAGNRGDFTVSIASNGAGTAVINSGAIDNNKVASDASIDGSKINPNFGVQSISTTGNITAGSQLYLSGGTPAINFTETDGDPDYQINVFQGKFHIKDTTVPIDRFQIDTDGDIRVYRNLTVNQGLNVSGQITGSSDLDLPDNAVIKLGNNDEFKILHNSSNSNSIIRETGGGILSLQTDGSQIDFWDSTNQVLMAQFSTGGACTFRHGATTRLATTLTGIAVTGDITSTGSLTITHNIPVVNFVDLSENPDYRIVVNSGQFKVQDTSDGNANRLIIEQTNTKVTNNLEVQGDLDVNGDISLSGTVDSVNIAARDTLFGALTSSSGVLINGVTATTQSELDNSSKIATTSYVDTAVSSLIDSAPGTLNTLNELAEALGDDANFATTVTNLIDAKLPLAGGTLSGDLTILKENPKLELNDPNTSDPNYAIRNDNGIFSIHDSTNSATKIQISKTANELTIFPKILANGGIELQDNDQIQLGSQTGGDCKIYHSGTNGYINNSTGDFIIKKSNNDRLTVNASGVAVNGAITATVGAANADILTLTANMGSSNSRFLKFSAPDTDSDSKPFTIATENALEIDVDNQRTLFIDDDGAVNLHHDGSSTAKLSTTATGVDVAGNLIATGALRNSVPSDFWNTNNTFVEVGNLGNITTHGAFEFTLTSGGYRFQVDGVGKWKDIEVDSVGGFGCQVALAPKTGKIHLRSDSGLSTDANNPSGSGLTDRLVVDQTGVDITGAITATASAANTEILKLITHNDRDLVFKTPNGDSGALPFVINTGNALEFKVDNSRAILLDEDTFVHLHHDGGTIAKLSTLATGVTVYGQVDINNASYARTMYQSSGSNMWSVGLRASASGDTNYHIYREAGHTGEVEIGAKINATGGLGVTGKATMTESNASTSNDLRKITTSTSSPTSSDGADGDIWIVVPS